MDSSFRILLASDDSSSREQSTFRLCLLGYAVTACEDLDRTLGQLRSAGRFGLLMVDLRLGITRAAELVSAVRGETHGASLPILLITGASDSHGPVSVQHILRRPFHLHELVMAIGHTLNAPPA